MEEANEIGKKREKKKSLNKLGSDGKEEEEYGNGPPCLFPLLGSPAEGQQMLLPPCMLRLLVFDAPTQYVDNSSTY